MIQNDFYIEKKAAVYPAYSDRRIHNSDDGTQITDSNIDNRVAKFGTQIDNKYVHRVPLKYFPDIAKIKFPTNIDMKIRLTLETEIKKCSNQRHKLQTLVRLTRK